LSRTPTCSSGPLALLEAAADIGDAVLHGGERRVVALGNVDADPGEQLLDEREEVHRVELHDVSELGVGGDAVEVGLWCDPMQGRDDGGAEFVIVHRVFRLLQ
jgi:hypothetical protein